MEQSASKVAVWCCLPSLFAGPMAGSASSHLRNASSLFSLLSSLFSSLPFPSLFSLILLPSSRLRRRLFRRLLRRLLFLLLLRLLLFSRLSLLSLISLLPLLPFFSPSYFCVSSALFVFSFPLLFLLFSLFFSLSSLFLSLLRMAALLTDIRGGRTRSRARNGNRGLPVNTKDAEDGSTIIRSVPFGPVASDLCLSPLQRSVNLSRPRALPVVKVLAINFLMVTLLQFCWLQETRSAGWEETLILSMMQAKSKTKTTTPEAELAQKETEYNKASSNWRFLEKKVQASTEAVERFRKELEREKERLPRLGPVWVQARKDAQQCLEDLRAVRSAVGSGLHRWKKTRTASSFKLNSSTFLQREQGQTRTQTTRPSSLAWTVWSLRPAYLLFKSGATTANVKEDEQCL